MPRISLGKALKGRMLEIAELQDMLIVALTKKFDVVIHGGTAVWRVYGGKRFSYDVDVYYRRPEEIGQFISKIDWARPIKRRITGSRRGYFRIEGRVPVELEVSAPPEGLKVVEGEFQLVDGTSIVVITLPPEELLKEKVAAFVDRKKGRDLYDIFYLLDLCDSEKAKGIVKGVIPFLGSPPKDFGGLEELVLMGRAPSFDTIRSKVLRYAKS